MQNLSLPELKKTATNYENLMVPALFVSWAQKVLDAAKPKPGDRILDVACGTGIVARIALNRNGGNGLSITGLDANPGMLSVAESKSQEIVWQEGVAEELPFEDESFDVMVSQFGLMFFQDKHAALQEMVRVLKPGGRLVVSVFDSLDNNPGYNALAEAFGRIAGEEVEQAMRAPFSLGDTTLLKSLCKESGIPSAEISTHHNTAHFPNVRTMVLADVKGWFPLAGIELTDEQIDEVVQQTESALAKYISEDGRVLFPMPGHFIRLIK